MLKIDEKDLETLLEKRKNQIGSNQLYGIPDLFAAAVFAFTLIFTDTSSMDMVPYSYFKYVMIGLTAAYGLYGMWQLVSSLLYRYTYESLLVEIKDLDPEIEHAFNIIVVKNLIENGKYLLFKSRPWRCFLFPNYRCETAPFDEATEMERMKKIIREDFNIVGDNWTIRYIGNMIDNKYSYNDRAQKKYNFHFFQIEGANVGATNEKKFRINGRQYCWRTVSQMLNDRAIVKKNKKVVDYVRGHCDLS